MDLKPLPCVPICSDDPGRSAALQRLDERYAKSLQYCRHRVDIARTPRSVGSCARQRRVSVFDHHTGRFRAPRPAAGQARSAAASAAFQGRGPAEGRPAPCGTPRIFYRLNDPDLSFAVDAARHRAADADRAEHGLSIVARFNRSGHRRHRWSARDRARAPGRSDLSGSCVELHHVRDGAGRRRRADRKLHPELREPLSMLRVLR